MREYDFHNCLSYYEFEDFAKDILQIKYDTPFRTYKVGRDFGVDIESTEKEGIFGQVKCYKDFDPLFNNLKYQELNKIKKLNPKQYILVTSVPLSKSQSDKILNLLQPYIQLDDLLDRKKLNELLSKPAYHQVERNHYKLWLTSTNILQEVLEGVINRGEKNNAKFELKEIASNAKYFVQYSSFKEALNLVEKNNYLVISGPPGSGKTTLGRALVNYYREKEKYKELVYPSNTTEALQLFKRNSKKQIFFFDDFVGKFKFRKSETNSQELIKLFRLIENIASSKNKILVLTTRNYVLKQANQDYPYELDNEVINFSKCTISPTGFTRIEKAKILFNHLYFSDLHKKEIERLTNLKYYYQIIDHENYTPRLIDDFINKKFLRNDSNRDYFSYHTFKEYLDEPYSFWEEAFKNLSREAQLILIIVFISGEPIGIRQLKESFESISRVYQNQFDDISITPDTFEECIKELQDSFLSIEEHYRYSYLIVAGFQTPYINDFFLRYLRNKHEIIEVLIEGARYFNQLDFVFSTREGRIMETDLHSDHHIHGDVIQIPRELRTAYKEKFLRDFDKLEFSNLESRESTDEMTLFREPDVINPWKLLRLSYLFEIEAEDKVRNFIVNRFQEFLDQFHSNENRFKIFPFRSMLYYPNLAKIVYPYQNKYSAKEIIEFYYSSITFAKEYDTLYRFKKIFPQEFNDLWSREIANMQNHIKTLISEDIEYFEVDYMHYEVDILIDFYIDELFEKYKIGGVESYKDEMTDLLKTYRNISPERRKKRLKKREKEIELMEQKNQKEKKNIDQLFKPLVFNRFGTDYLELDDILENVSRSTIPNKVKNKILSSLKNDDTRYMEDCLRDDLPISLLSNYVVERDEIPESKAKFYHSLVVQILHNLDLDFDVIVRILGSLCFHTYTENKFYISRKNVSTYINESDFQDNLHEVLDSLYPIIQRKQKWYKLLNEDVHLLFVAIYIRDKISDKRKFYRETLYEHYYQLPDVQYNMWEYLLLIDRIPFLKFFIIPQLSELINEIKDDSKYSIFQSYIDYFGIEVDLDQDENGFELEGGGNSKGLQGDLLRLFDIYLEPFDVMYLFSFRHYEDESTETAYRNLCKYITKECEVSDNGRIRFKISELTEDEKFNSLLEDVKMFEYFEQEYNKLLEKMSKLKSEIN